MRFISISIENYRQYRNLRLDFYPGKHDLQIIVADNGVGKTNLLNAFTWCLYGEEPHLGMVQDNAGKQKVEPKLNKEVIAECIADGVRQSYVMVTIDIEVGSGARNSVMRVSRRLPFVVKPDGSTQEKFAEQHFSIVRMGPGAPGLPMEGERAEEYLDRFLPQSIREYFFFDGEQLNSYFRADDVEKIKTAVYSISQIGLFSDMIKHLHKVVTDKRREAASCSKDTSVLEKKQTEAEQLLEGCKRFIKEKEAEIGLLRQRLNEVDDQLRGVDNVGLIEQRRDAALNRYHACEDRLNRSRREYFDFTRNAVVDFYLYPALSGALSSIRELESEGELPPSIDSARLLESLEQGRCIVCNHELSVEERGHIERLLEQFKVGSETSNILSSMSSELRRAIDSIERYPSESSKRLESLGEAEEALSNAAESLKEIEAIANKYAETGEGIKQLYRERDEYQRQIDALNQQIGTRRNNMKRAESDILNYGKKLENALKQNTKAAQLKNMVDFGNAALEVLREAESAVVDETRRNMERRTEELFKGLVWKESKCDHIELSSNYIPALYDRAGFSCAGTCSAAERSLLALSFTLAMHEVSGFESPLFIDTPIARASGENRENFARTLVEVSKEKQLILAFTPDEYSESISNEFEPAISTYIRLKLDESESHVVEPEVENRGA